MTPTGLNPLPNRTAAKARAKTLVRTMLAMAGLGLAGAASACSFNVLKPDDYGKCIYNEVYNGIVDAAKSDAAKVVDAANSSAATIRSDAQATATKALNAALATAKATKAAVPLLCE